MPSPYSFQLDVYKEHLNIARRLYNPVCSSSRKSLMANPAYLCKVVSPSTTLSSHAVMQLGKVVVKIGEIYAHLFTLPPGKDTDATTNHLLSGLEKELMRARTNRDFYDFKFVRSLIVATPKVALKAGVPNLSIGLQFNQGAKPYIIVSGNYDWVQLTTSA